MSPNIEPASIHTGGLDYQRISDIIAAADKIRNQIGDTLPTSLPVGMVGQVDQIDPKGWVGMREAGNTPQ